MRDKQRLYLMDNAYGFSKIGISDNPERRRRQLENAAGIPVDLIRCWITLEDTAYNVEQALHVEFSRRRTGGEWFKHIDVKEIEYAGFELLECQPNGKERRM